MTPRIAVLASGGGSNLQAILDYFRTPAARAHAEVALVVSDRMHAKALERAREAGVPAVHIPAAELEARLASVLAEHRIDLVALAGFLKMIPRDVVRTFAGRIVNVHPGLLPKFGGHGMYGRYVHESVLAAGERESGVSVHYVDEIYDNGAVIEQVRVPVLPNDTAGTLAARVLVAEHELYPRILERLASFLRSSK